MRMDIVKIVLITAWTVNTMMEMWHVFLVDLEYLDMTHPQQTAPVFRGTFKSEKSRTFAALSHAQIAMRTAALNAHYFLIGIW